MKVGTKIIVNPFSKFPEIRMTCIGRYIDGKYNKETYIFDNGLELTREELGKRLRTWDKQNGYKIVEE